ncbi:MAG: TIGR02221 family CRISPR-associated protein [Bacillota bacterium]|nr:TIGR02221 family CRISPR-associated protein [Bacillota bacterium]
MKLLSFLGNSEYEEITYVLDGQRCKTRYFPIAACHFFEPVELVLFLTQAAYDRHAVRLKNELAGRLPLTEVLLPHGRAEDEMWLIFNALTHATAEGDEIVLDITHGFRSLPVLAVLAAVFLQVAKRVHLRRLVYGAYDAKTGDGELAEAPVFDLTPFVTLIDWTVAADRFLETGDARELAKRLEEAQDEQHLRRRGGDLPRNLKGAARAIRKVSQAMALARSHEVMEWAARAVSRVERAADEVNKWAQPFSLLLGRITEMHAALAMDKPLADVPRTLLVQFELLRRYLNGDQLIQAVTLAREWVVSLVCYRLGYHLLDWEERRRVENLLNDALSRDANLGLEEVPQQRDIVHLWGRLRELRNDLAHAGMRENARHAEDIFRQSRHLAEQLEPLVSCLGNCPGT